MNPHKAILIVEDEPAILRVLAGILHDALPEYRVLQAHSGSEALEVLANEEVALVLCDIKMPAPDGLEVLITTQKTKKDIAFIMISGHGDIDTAVECMRSGAFDYISKPPDLRRLLSSIQNALKPVPTTTITSQQPSPIPQDGMIGTSPAMASIRRMIEKVAPTDAKILVRGENGTGKELVVRSIHYNSRRKSEALIEVNCAAIPSELIESELFGHEKGAFTTALKQYKGKFEQADHGTLFLDEIGDMSLAAQAKVLRAIQEGEINRVGGNKAISVDVRVIAATNKPIEHMIVQGTFREDLYHRISVIEISVPSLDERKEDIPLLISYFLTQLAAKYNTTPKNITPQAIQKLVQRSWTGNIRQLQNVVERLVILSDGGTITEDDVL